MAPDKVHAGTFHMLGFSFSQEMCNFSKLRFLLASLLAPLPLRTSFSARSLARLTATLTAAFHRRTPGRLGW
jgi:hypothetical protein